MLIGLIPSCSIHQMLPIFSGVVKDCIKVQEKKNKVVILCSRSPQNVKLGIFVSQLCSDGKEMYKKGLCSCKVVLLPTTFCQPIAFLPFSLTSLWSLLYSLIVNIDLCGGTLAQLQYCITALFKNTQILKFKSQLMIVFFAATNHPNGPLRISKLYFNEFKRSWFVICDWWIWIRFVCFCVSRFVACDRNYD